MLGGGLQSVALCGLQNMLGVDYKVWQNGLQSALGIKKCGRMDYKVRQGLQSELVHMVSYCV